MKKLISALLLAMLTLQPVYAKIVDVDRVVAIVNNDIITLSALNFRVKDAERQMGAQALKKINKEELRQEMLEQMIEEEILVQYAQEMNIQISDAEIDQYISMVAAQQKSTVPNFYKEAQKQGLTRDKLRHEISNSLMVNQVKEREINSRITVTDSEIDQELGSSHTALQNQQVRMSAILIATGPKASEQTIQSKAETATLALNALDAGDDFAAVAKKYSNLSNKNKGGDMGFQAASRLPAELNSLLGSLAIGQHTEIIYTPEGFYIFKLTERKQNGQQAGSKIQKSYRTEHILIKVNELTSDAQALKRITDIQQRLNQNGDFSALAKQYSEDGSALQGGSLGWLRLGETVPEFEKIMVSLPINQISQPVRSPFGYHLIKVIDTREEDVAQAQKRQAIRQRISDYKAQQIYKEWVEQIVSGAHIVNKLNEE